MTAMNNDQSERRMYFFLRLLTIILIGAYYLEPTLERSRAAFILIHSTGMLSPIVFTYSSWIGWRARKAFTRTLECSLAANAGLLAAVSTYLHYTWFHAPYHAGSPGVLPELFAGSAALWIASLAVTLVRIRSDRRWHTRAQVANAAAVQQPATTPSTPSSVSAPAAAAIRSAPAVAERQQQMIHRP